MAHAPGSRLRAEGSAFTQWAAALRTRVRPLSDDEVHALASGALDSPEGYYVRTGKPWRGGLYCSRTFGPTEDHKCLCGKYEGASHAGLCCEKCGVLVGSPAMRSTRWGEVRFELALRHPWFPEHALRRWPVLPAGLRDDRPTPTLAGLDAHYSALLHRRLDAHDCVRNGAPALVLENEQRALEDALAKVLGSEQSGPRATHLLGRLYRASELPLAAPEVGTEAAALLCAMSLQWREEGS